MRWKRIFILKLGLVRWKLLRVICFAFIFDSEIIEEQKVLREFGAHVRNRYVLSAVFLFLFPKIFEESVSRSVTRTSTVIVLFLLVLTS